MRAVVTLEMTVRLDEEALKKLQMELPKDYPVEWWEAELLEKLNGLTGKELSELITRNPVKINDVYLEELE